MNKLPKVLCLYGNSVYYGHERSNIQVFSLIKRLDFDVTVLINKKGIADAALQVLLQEKISFREIVYPNWSDVRKPFTIRKILSYLTDVVRHNISFYKYLSSIKPDYIYIANDFMYMSLVPSFILSKTKIIYRLGDKPVTGWMPFRVLWQKYIVHRTHRFVCISQFIKECLKVEGRTEIHQDQVIYNYPPIRVIKNIEPINFKKEGAVFSYLGQIISIKGVDLFIDAAITVALEYPGVKFVIAGDLKYDSIFSKELIARVKNLGLSDRIVFLGAIENIEDFFGKTDVLVTPSVKEEPLGNVIVEAKKYYTPSIIFPSGGMPELITHSVDGYICNDSTADELVKAMKYYLSSPLIIEEHGISANKSIIELGIGEEEFKRRWINVFQS